MKNIIFSSVFTFMVVGGMALGNEPVVENAEVEKAEVDSHITAKLGDTAANKNRIYIYSTSPLKAVSFSADAKAWAAMLQDKRQGDHYVFATPNLAKVDLDQKYQVFGMLADGGLFTDELAIVEHEEKEDLLAVSVKALTEISPEQNFNSPNPVITLNEIWHGGSTLPPKTVARARVVYMANHGAGVHFGSAGSLQTNVGPLSEGWGSGEHTCMGNGPCYANEWVTGPYGSHHLRFFRGGTFASGGGGGGRRWRR